jgi:hypothetical protein
MYRAELADTDADILERVVQPNRADLTPAAARALLAHDFTQADRDRMHQLAVKNQSGKLTAAERWALDGYRRVGWLLDLLSCDARRSLPCPRDT